MMSTKILLTLREATRMGAWLLVVVLLILLNGASVAAAHDPVNLGSIPVGTRPKSVVVSPDNRSLYSISYGTNLFSAADLETLILQQAILVAGASFGSDVAVTPDGQLVLVTGGFDLSVHVYDTAAGVFLAPIWVPEVPLRVEVSPDRTTAAVTLSGFGGIALIDLGTFTTRIVTGVGLQMAFNDLAFNADGSRLYSTIGGADQVAVIDVSAGSLLATVPTGGFPKALVLAPDESRLYVVNASSDSVTVVDTATRTVVGHVPVGQWPADVAVTPDGSTLLVICRIDGTLYVIDTASLTVQDVLPTGDRPVAIITHPDGTSAYLIARGPIEADLLQRYDVASRTISSSIDLEGDFEFNGKMALSPDTSTLVVPVSTSAQGMLRVFKVADPVLPTQQVIERLIGEVEALESTGVLNPGQSNALTAKLEAALDRFDRDHVNAAINQLQAFINQVNGLINGGVLLPAEAQPLIDAANDIINALRG